MMSVGVLPVAKHERSGRRASAQDSELTGPGRVRVNVFLSPPTSVNGYWRTVRKA